MKEAPFSRLLRMLELDRKDIIYVYVYAVLAGIITLSLPLGIQAIIGLIAGGSVSSALFILLGVVTLGVALTGLLKIMQLSVVEVILQRIFLRSAIDFSFRLPRFKLEGLTQKYPPELMNRFFDTLTLQKGIPKILIDFSSASFQIFIGLLLISFYHPFFVFFSFLLLVILFLIFRYTGPVGLKTSMMESKYKYAVAHWLEEIARSMYVTGENPETTMSSASHLKGWMDPIGTSPVRDRGINLRYAGGTLKHCILNRENHATPRYEGNNRSQWRKVSPLREPSEYT
ncbi:MAG: hypothetical protein ACKOZZ_12835 [Bacteroidota bacterium]